MLNETSPLQWTPAQVQEWLRANGHGKYSRLLGDDHNIDGQALLLLTEADLHSPPLGISALGDIKRLSSSIRRLQMQNSDALIDLGYDPSSFFYVSNPLSDSVSLYPFRAVKHKRIHDNSLIQDMIDSQHNVPKHANDCANRGLQPEIGKTFLSMFYLFVVTWITAFVMVVVHDRVPDMKKYPPLPDIFLDNVPTIPWAFSMCELTGTLLLIVWVGLLAVHKHRIMFGRLIDKLIKLLCQRFSNLFKVQPIALGFSVGFGTLLKVIQEKCQCTLFTEEMYTSLSRKIQRAYIIWRGAGMSIQGVRTCGDYMFSGHTVALTMLNFFITEYTPRHLYLVHTFTWVLNMFGIFFILSAHEHYSIDVFIAFYITSRLFLYYHTLANNQSLMQRDSNRTRIWFPLFSFFESSVDGIVPNEYESPLVPLSQLCTWILENIHSISQNAHLQLLGKKTPNPETKVD